MNTNEIARIASLVGEPARTAMLLALMDGRALTALELAHTAGVGAPTASRHLAQLVEAGLLSVEQHGRHRYHRLASADVARLLEGIMQLAVRRDAPRRAVLPGPKDAALRTARTCYDHLAGRLGVAIAERLLDAGAITFEGETGHVTASGQALLERSGIVTGADGLGLPARRAPCRPCLDWSERRFHVAGRLGAMICAHCLERGWLLRRAGTRALEFTPKGTLALRDWLGPKHWRRVTEPSAQAA